MASEWRSTTIGDLCDAGIVRLQTGPFGSQLHAQDYTEVGVPVVPTEAIRDRQIDHSVLPRISVAKAEELARHRLRPGDILFARRGVQATGHIGYVREAESGFICGTGAILLRVNEDSRDINSHFLSHILANPVSVEWFKFHAIGATMPNLNESIIRFFPLLIPPLDEQIAVANILGALDDKIELNRQTNETLEAIARLLFKSWFVDFDPVRAKAEGRDPGLATPIADLFPDAFDNTQLGEMPKGWEVGQISELADLRREQVNPLAWPEESFSHYSIPAFDEGQRPKAERGEEIKSLKSVVFSGSVLLSKLNPEIDRTWLVDVQPAERAICSTEFLVLSPKKLFGREYIYCLLRSQIFRQTLESFVTGTSKSHQRAQAPAILGIEVVLPPPLLVEAFAKIVGPMFDRSLASRRESRTLASLRDTLLPKLISGELRVKDGEKFVTV